MAKPGARAMHADELRRLCDAYFDPRTIPCNEGITFFLADYISDVRDWAKAALNVYNGEEQNNFYLEKVVQLNQVSECSFLTFWATSDESADPCLFRAVVDPQIGGIEVLLCEIKDGDEMSIPKYHIECVPCLPTRDGDHLSCAWFDRLSCSLDGVVDAYGGLDVGEGDVYLGSAELYGKSAGYQSVEVHDLSDLRDSCDIYMDPRKAQCGGGVTQFYVDNNSCVRGWAKTALNAYNEEKHKNFYLEKVVKLNQLSMYAYLTFWARSDESVERRLFRGGVGGIKVLLCEIKDDEEMIVPVGHEEYCPRTPISVEDHSPYYYPWNESVFTDGSAGSSIDVNCVSAIGNGGV